MDRQRKDTVKRFERRVARFMADNALPEAGSRLVVGLSGGADSTALAAVLTALGYEVVAAHCNFRLRGDESRRDSHHACRIAEQLDIDIHVRDFDVAGRMALSGESVEMACRSLRYEWFQALLERHRARAVAVGHHREDNAETLMLNLLRGTGTAGLGGIRPRRDYVVRPLLDVSRAEIEAYLQARGLEWVDDSSNATDDYTRNRIRHHILPALEAESPGATDAIVRTARNVEASNALYRIAVERMGEKYVGTDAEGAVSIDAAGMFADLGGHMSSPATTLLFETIRRYGFGHDVALSVAGAIAEGRSGQSYLTATHRAMLDRGVLTIESAMQGSMYPESVEISLSRDVLVPLHIEITEHPVADFSGSVFDNSHLYLDAAALEGDPVFTLRRWRRGDRIEAYGMNGRSKLVSDVFVQARMSQRDKERAWLLCRNDVILWVVGVRASRHYAVGPDTRRYLCMRLK